MSTQKILHLAKYYFPVHGGMETATKDLAETAVSLGYDVHCQSASMGNSSSHYEHHGVKVKAYPARWKLLSTPISLPLFFQKIDRDSLVHIHLPNPLLECRILFSLLFFKGIKVSPFFHAFPVGQGWLGRVWFKVITARILSRVKVILVSDMNIPSSVPAVEKWRDKFVVMPFAVDAINVDTGDALLAKRTRSHVVCAVGRLVKYKGFATLIQAWLQLQQNPRFKHFTLKIVGEGPEHQFLQSLVSGLGLDDSIEICGAISDKAKQSVLEEACLFVAPSLSSAETFGISILEAMSWALPVVTTSLQTGVATLARQGDCGGVVEPGNIRQLAEAMERILGDVPFALESYGKKNLIFAREQYSRSKLQERYTGFLKNYFNC